MKVVIVGAGSVGQAYGYHLHCGGAELTFLMRPGTAQRLDGGLHLAPLNRPRRDRFKPVNFTDFRVVAAAEDCPSDADQVWLCMPLTGFHDDQIRAIAAHCPQATIVSMMSSLALRQRLRGIVDAERLVFGLIPLAGMPTPRADLPIETHGQAWWFPPGARTTFSGSRAKDVAGLARRGGAPSRVVADTTKTNAVGASALIPMIAGLELAGWSTRAYGGSEASRMAAKATGEIQRAIAASVGGAGPVAIARHPWATRLFLRVAQVGAPFDFEGFLKSHFSKVGPQTEAMFREWIAVGQNQGLPMEACQTLLDRLIEARR